MGVISRNDLMDDSDQLFYKIDLKNDSQTSNKTQLAHSSIITSKIAQISSKQFD